MSHPVFARLWSRWLVARLERAGVSAQRDELLAGLHGTVLEVGAGEGVNLARYGTEVERVVAVEPEAHLRELATRAALAAAVPVEVVDGLAERLPLPEDSVDAVVLCLVLCSVPDVGAALAEVRRVLRPGGEVRVLEHVRSTGRQARVERALDATVWPLVGGGCHLSRDTGAALAAAGFTTTGLRSVQVPPRGPRGLKGVLGSARLA